MDEEFQADQVEKICASVLYNLAKIKESITAEEMSWKTKLEEIRRGIISEGAQNHPLADIVSRAESTFRRISSRARQLSKNPSSAVRRGRAGK